ncbi:retinoic acid receptor RXR-alpha-B-like [Pecten maximus]|uniref:retinoic acid receptor RXR-alpha-B-like n=1 Tax=Pecten maximus TaxID=6579 RepID=UPI00145888A6|nr:retinoic acid receptor RXR-alpha-B-like [Pecten maximus]
MEQNHDPNPLSPGHIGMEQSVVNSSLPETTHIQIEQAQVASSGSNNPIAPRMQNVVIHMGESGDGLFSPDGNVVFSTQQHLETTSPNGQSPPPIYVSSLKPMNDNIIQIETVTDVQDQLDSSTKQSGMMSCLVCNDKGSGYHYSVFSCEGCKGFFKRTVQKNLMYTCKDVGNCNINKFTRNNCQYCRFMKCQQMGMKREAVREDRSPGGKHRHKRPRLEDMQSIFGTDGGLSIMSETDRRSEIYEQTIEGLIQAKADLMPHFDGATGLQSMGINEMMQFGYAELKFIIDWAKKVPGFQDFCIEDQMALLKSSFMELNILRLSFRSIDYDESIKFADGFILPTEVAKGMGFGKELVTAISEFSRRLKEMEMDIVEFNIMNAIVLTYPDAAGLKEKTSITVYQTKMLDVLRHYMTQSHPDDPRRYGKMLLRLPSLRTVSAKAAERFLSLTLDGSIQLNDLVLEMIN